MGIERKDILIVDDSSFVRIVLRVAMQTQGYTVREATDGDEALQSLASAVPDLLISDYDMPGLNGLELLSRVRSNRRTAELPVLILSSRNDSGLQTEAKRAGAQWVQKPFQTARFMDLITRTLGSEAPAI